MGAGRRFSARRLFSASLADYRRQRWPLPELPPIIHIDIAPFLETQMQDNNRHNAPATTKSCIPTTTRCIAHPQPQLRHVIAENASDPTPAPFDRHSQFLGDSAIDLQALYEADDLSYWCLLRVETKPPAIPSNRFNLLCFDLVPTGFTYPLRSGLVVDYSVCRKSDSYSYWSKSISIRHECAMVDPFDAKKKQIEFTNSVVRSRGKIYAVSLQGTLVVMQASGDGRLKITGMSAIRAIPSSNWKFYDEYLVEMNGEILLAFLIHQKSLAIVDRVEVFRLDFVKLGWSKVEKLGGKTLFLKERSIWVASAELGCRENCVYFCEGSDDRWKVCDMKNGNISSVLFENKKLKYTTT